MKLGDFCVPGTPRILFRVALATIVLGGTYKAGELMKADEPEVVAIQNCSGLMNFIKAAIDETSKANLKTVQGNPAFAGPNPSIEVLDNCVRIDLKRQQMRGYANNS